MFKLSKIKKGENERITEIEAEKEPLFGGKHRDLQDDIYKFLKREFSAIDAPENLNAASGASSPPLCVLKGENRALSLWYRLPLKGETGVMYIPDFSLFKGSQRISSRERNPDILIECRKMPPETSNRTDPRVVREMIGTALDTFPALLILVTDRPLSAYANGLAKDYGIAMLSLEGVGDPQSRLTTLLKAEVQPTREKLRHMLDKGIHKLDNYYRIGKKLSISGREPSTKTGLRDRVMKSLKNRPGMNVVQLSSILGVHQDFILNELHMMERDGTVRVSKKSDTADSYKYEQWALTKEGVGV